MDTKGIVQHCVITTLNNTDLMSAEDQRVKLEIIIDK